MKDIMIDLETLGTRSTSAIVQIGACYFDRETGEIGKEFYDNIKLDEVDLRKMTVDHQTINWWLNQSEEARKSITDQGAELGSVMFELYEFLCGGKFLWSHATFDIPILEHAFECTSFKNPIPYRGMRDIRTLMDLADHRSESEREGTHHDALDDCKFQVIYCVEALNKLKNEN